MKVERFDAIERRLNQPRTRRRRPAIDATARGLGWFSIGLGVAEILMPRLLARMSGMRSSAMLVTACGLREVATGVGLLGRGNPTPWMWGRVGGDAIDLAAMAAALATSRGKGRALIAMTAVAAVTALDVATAKDLAARERRRLDAGRYDYSDRSGFPRPATQMRGAAFANAGAAPSASNARLQDVERSQVQAITPS